MIPNGAFLFILEQDGGEPAKYRADGIGNASHMGIKTGIGEGAIHSSKSRGCVCTSVFRDKSINGGWNRVGLWDAIDYGGTVNGRLRTEEGICLKISKEEARVLAELGKRIRDI